MAKRIYVVEQEGNPVCRKTAVQRPDPEHGRIRRHVDEAKYRSGRIH